ncbi:YopX family protein [Staphylococcus equorum]|uniref:YopX family protein n=1 Tax=Staphylococcus equorum TaxID=246432 RepID=UPI003D804DAE
MENLRFRAWDKEDKRMKEVFNLDFHRYTAIVGFRLSEPKSFLNDRPLIILQSTGIKDKNGVEIFEGDIVKTKYSEHGRHIGVVKYGGAKFYSNGVKQYLSWHEDLNGLFEIIGNKFEHPHLLEGDNE